jgi:hypothetical protein
MLSHRWASSQTPRAPSLVARTVNNRFSLMLSLKPLAATVSRKVDRRILMVVCSE